jgi:hypothetical protein
MRELSNDRLRSHLAKRSVMRMTFRYPSFEEMRALERAAHRARAQEVRRVLSAVVDWFKARPRVERPRFAHP